MPSVTLEPIDPQPPVGWRIIPENALNIFEALAIVGMAGYTGSIVCTLVAGGLEWELRISKPSTPTLIGRIGDWIIFDGTNAIILTDEECTARYTQSGS